MPPLESQIVSRTKPPAAVTTHAISAAHSIPRLLVGLRTDYELPAPAVCYRRASIAAESLWRQPDARRCLAALVLGAVDQRERPLHDVRVEPVLWELLARAVLLDVRLEHAVERVVGWEGVLVELVVAQLRARRAVDDRLGNDLFARALVQVPREPEDVGLEHVLEQREAAGHVAVERRVADR